MPASFTAVEGATLSSQCNVCKPGTCKHGTCSIDGNSQFTCSCDAGYTGVSCETNALGIALGTVFGTIVLVLIALWIVRRLKKQVLSLTEYRELQEQLLEDKDTELKGLKVCVCVCMYVCV